MRILALTSQYPTPYQPHSCGHNRQQIAALSQEAEVQVIAPVAWTQEWTAKRKQRRQLPPSDRQVSIPVRHPQFRYLPGIFRQWQGECFRRSIRRVFTEVLEQFQPDVIYAPWAYPDGWSAVKLGHAAGLPVVVKVMGSDVHTLSLYPGRRRGTLETLHEADAVVAVSRQLAEEVVELGANPDRVHIVYNGVDRSLFFPGSRSEVRRTLGLDSNVPRVLFVGNLVPVKQVPVLIEACAVLRDRRRNFHCHILGDGPLRKSLTSQIERQRLTAHITLEGLRPHSELADWFRAADVVALASRSEGVPNVLLEARACGVPFVASRVGGIPEIAGAFDRLVPANDPAALAESLEAVLAEDRPDIPEGRPHASWPESARQLLAIFQQVQQPMFALEDRCPEEMSAAVPAEHSM